MSRVFFRGNRRELRQVIHRLRGILVGRENDPLGIGRGLFLSMGFAALSDIKNDFVTKARGGVGEDGQKWPPLSKEYLAYGRRFGPGEKTRLKKHAGLGKAHRFGGPAGQIGLLTKAQAKRWRQIFASRLQRFLLSLPMPEAKARAAQVAWATIKREGGKTMLEVFGNRQVEILRDTGILLNSLSPGELSHVGPNATYSPPSGEGGELQAVELLGNGVIVGTNVPYAASHQYGDSKRGIPARPFLPSGDVPETWEQRWLDTAGKALEAGLRLAVENHR